MGKKIARKSGKVELSPAKRVFSEDRSGKGLTQGKSVNDIRAKYLGAGVDSKNSTKIKKVIVKKDPNVKAMIIKRKATGKFTDQFVQGRTVLMSKGKIIGEQG